ncbi:c-type cytochrome [Acidipila rosea]|uniref:Photosynthetic reaction center cytochrome c subunit n=1 Tax=Acidipila rosea TaxID=768535 RepID=A0A4R1L1R9_9BACT|nr:c-type cytochrome [Acidipila rosea]MBW4028001.1 c-type cytochrome [Acidobacteriota bacterium]MBW4045846.1 c-type cytochrome [Acidobacteriota bacterium]TCK71912.1 photosynthetic reaction center cytochrome c subunit [Acidipila rosea]
MMNKASLVTLAAILSLTPAIAFSQKAKTPPQDMHHELPKPTNLQVLPRDIPPKELVTLMRGYAGQLGVKCNYCHARDEQTKKLNFASDANPQKANARTMIAMTMEINQKYLSRIKDPDMPMVSKVECGTCHRGHDAPEAYIPPPEKPEHH